MDMLTMQRDMFIVHRSLHLYLMYSWIIPAFISMPSLMPIKIFQELYFQQMLKMYNSMFLMSIYKVMFEL